MTEFRFRNDLFTNFLPQSCWKRKFTNNLKMFITICPCKIWNTWLIISTKSKLAAYFMLMWCGDTGSLSRCMPVRGEHVGAHGGLWAKLGKPATKMAHTYQIQIQYSAFSEITCDNSTKYWPTVLGILRKILICRKIVKKWRDFVCGL